MNTVNTIGKAMDKALLLAGNELGSCRNMRNRLSRRLHRFPAVGADDQLSFYCCNGRMYYSLIWYENGKKRKRYLGTADNREVMEIQERRFISKALELLDKRIGMLESCNETLSPLDFDAVNNSLPKAYRLQSEHITNVIGPDAEERWYTKALKEKTADDARYGIRYAEKRIHQAKDGTLMRSKSEVSIANELINRGIPYLYEKPIMINHFVMHPDFMFYSFSRMKPMIWEHSGMLGDPKYMNDFSARMDNYIRGGLVPCVDILFSFDTIDGSIDTRIIDAIIDEYR